MSCAKKNTPGSGGNWCALAFAFSFFFAFIFHGSRRGLAMELRMATMGTLCAAVALLSAAASSSSDEARHRDLQRASGLMQLPQAELAAKYSPTAGTMEAFPNTTAGTFFSGVFGDHVVLQREPAKAAVYGVIFGAKEGTTVTVDVASPSGAAIYSVPGTVMVTEQQMPGGRYAK